MPDSNMKVHDIQALYQENLGPIYRFVYSKIRNREEAEDLTSQIFIKAIRGVDDKRDKQSIRKWLFQVARTTIADYWRAYYRASTSSLETLLEAGWEGPTGDEPFDRVSDSIDRVHCILEALPERHREVLTCRFLLNLSIRETAIRMGITETYVKVLQFRALKRAADLEPIVAESALCK
jgi:RNA polymerase sigma-70 factor (ECF subfamily)